MRKGIIYKAKNIINGKIYIGKTVKSLKRRKTEHQSKNKQVKKSYLKNSIFKYGKENFEWSILGEYLIENLNEREIYWIEKYKSYDINIGYNLTKGGDGAPYGDLNPSKRDDVKEKLRISNTGFKHSEKTKKLLSDYAKKQFENGFPDETRKKISESLKGREGIKGSDNVLSKKYKFISPDGEIHELKGLNVFCKLHSLDCSAMSKVNNGKLKTHKGWKKFK